MRLSEIKAISPAGAHQKEHLTPPKSLQRSHRIQARRKNATNKQIMQSGPLELCGAYVSCWCKTAWQMKNSTNTSSVCWFYKRIWIFCSSGTGAFRLNVNYFTLLQRARSTNEQPQWAQLNRTAPFRTELEWLSNYNSISDCEFHLN